MRWLIFLLCMGAAPVAAACPDPSLGGARYAADGPGLIAPQSWAARAGGSEVAPCLEWQWNQTGGEDLAGYLPVAPTAVFELVDMAPHILTVRADAECRPVLAVRSGDGLWFFGETKNRKQEVTLWGAPDGPLQVWLGAATPEGCDGTIELETYDR